MIFPEGRCLQFSPKLVLIPSRISGGDDGPVPLPSGNGPRLSLPGWFRFTASDHDMPTSPCGSRDKLLFSAKITKLRLCEFWVGDPSLCYKIYLWRIPVFSYEDAGYKPAKLSKVYLSLKLEVIRLISTRLSSCLTRSRLMLLPLLWVPPL